MLGHCSIQKGHPGSISIGTEGPDKMVYATHTSNLVVMLLPLRNIAVIAMSLLVVDAVILTRTLTRTLKTTLTVKEFTHTFCASFVNATTACRRRRQALVEMPILIAFDPVDAIDTNLRGLPTIFDPTSVLPLVFSCPLLCSNSHLLTFQWYLFNNGRLSWTITRIGWKKHAVQNCSSASKPTYCSRHKAALLIMSASQLRYSSVNFSAISIHYGQ